MSNICERDKHMIMHVIPVVYCTLLYIGIYEWEGCKVTKYTWPWIWPWSGLWPRHPHLPRNNGCQFCCIFVFMSEKATRWPTIHDPDIYLRDGDLVCRPADSATASAAVRWGCISKPGFNSDLIQGDAIRSEQLVWWCRLYQNSCYQVYKLNAVANNLAMYQSERTF